MIAFLDTRHRGLDARVVDRIDADSEGNTYHTLSIRALADSTGGDAGQVDLTAYDEGLYEIVAAIVLRLDDVQGMEDVGLGLVNQLGTTTARALAHALIGECDERDRLAAMRPLERVAYLEALAAPARVAEVTR